MKTITVIQARTGSSRLPGKVLLPLGGKPLLSRMIERVREASLVGEIVVATTKDAADDAIVELCRYLNVACFRGSTEDCLDRHYQAMLEFRADIVVKIPSDCPLIDPDIIDRVLDVFVSSDTPLDYVSNLHPQSYPDGNDVEVMGAEALTVAWREASKPFEREHTTPFIWDRPERFRLKNVTWDRGDFSKAFRWTLDYREDYELISAVFGALYDENPGFGFRDIIDFVCARPDIAALNRNHLGHGWYAFHKDELKTLELS